MRGRGDMVARAQTITVADESLVLVISRLTLRLLGLPHCGAATVNAEEQPRKSQSHYNSETRAERRLLYGDRVLILDLISKVLRSDIKLSFTYSKFTNYLGKLNNASTSENSAFKSKHSTLENIDR